MVLHQGETMDEAMLMDLLHYHDVAARLGESTADTPARRSLLEGIELYDGIGERELERLECLGRQRHYQEGEAIVREGESGIAMFVMQTVFAATSVPDPGFVALSFGVSLLLALLGSAGPMMSVFKLDPVRSLRGE